MATYTLISSNVLSSTTASVSFTSIPATYTDLLIKMSLRSDGATTGGSGWFRINSLSTSIYSETELRGNGSAASSTNQVATTIAYFNYFVGGTGTTASTFSNTEIYLPSYLASQNKLWSSFNAMETNATAGYLSAQAGLIQSTAAITSLQFNCDSGSWVSGSSFYLYGISNA
jgi:hypothetical protein